MFCPYKKQSPQRLLDGRVNGHCTHLFYCTLEVSVAIYRRRNVSKVFITFAMKENYCHSHTQSGQKKMRSGLANIIWAVNFSHISCIKTLLTSEICCSVLEKIGLELCEMLSATLKVVYENFHR
jgi:hypothetical protein